MERDKLYLTWRQQYYNVDEEWMMTMVMINLLLLERKKDFDVFIFIMIMTMTRRWIGLMMIRQKESFFFLSTLKNVYVSSFT